MNGPGFFLTFEGIEGSGKTTQIQRLSQQIRSSGQNIVLTKEPGGTPLANRIRAILLDPHEEAMDGMTELLLYEASRRQHVVDLIRPALERGAIVLSDRFTDATLAYQGYGRLLDMDRLQTLNRWVTDGLTPDLTVIFDLSETESLERARERNRNSKALQDESRLEGEDLRFHRRVREGYLAIAEGDLKRYAVLDAGGTPDEVFDRLTTLLSARAERLKLATAPG